MNLKKAASLDGRGTDLIQINGCTDGKMGGLIVYICAFCDAFFIYICLFLLLPLCAVTEPVPATR